MTFRGVIPIVSTPFDRSGALDVESLRSLVDYLVDSGVHGLAVLGVASEIYALTDLERAEVVRTVVEQNNGRLPVLAGSSHNSGEAAAILSRACEEAGVDGLLVMPPYFVKPDPDALIAYFAQVDAAVHIPVMIQDNPNWTGVSIPMDVYRKIADLPNVRYAKVEVPHPPTKVRNLKRAIGDQLVLFGGLAGNWLLEELAAGTAGTMPASIMPQVYVYVWDLWQAGDTEKARVIFNRYHPVVRVTAQQTAGFAMVKFVLWRLGVIKCPHVRNPLAQLRPEDQADLEAVIAEVDLLSVMNRTRSVAASG